MVEEGIMWCKNNISPTYNHFEFEYIPLRNDLYNLDTQQQASAFTFPYPSNQFNLVVLTSVFTHMQLPEVNRYLSEISRVLLPGGKCLSTFFVMDELTLANLKKHPQAMRFNYEYGDYYLHNKDVKDANIAFKLDALTAMIKQHGLEMETYNKGWWQNPNQPNALNYQDVLVLTKPTKA